MNFNLVSGSDNAALQTQILWNGLSESLPYVLLDDLPHLVWVKDPQGRYVYINAAYRRFHGLCDFSERIGLTDADIYPEPAASRYRQEDLQVFTTRLPLNIEDRHGQGSPHFPAIYDTSKRPIFSPDGCVVGVYGISREITASRAQDEQTAHQNRLLAALHEISLELMQQHDLQVLLPIILQRSAEVVGAPVGLMHFFDSESASLKVVHAWGTEGATPSSYHVKKGQALAGRVWQLESVIVLDDYQTWEHQHPTPYLQNIRATVGVPIRSNNQIAGVVTLIHTDPEQRFSSVDVATLEQFSALASVALENARLFEEASAELRQRRASDERYRALVQQSSEAILLIDPPTRSLLQANEHFLALTGYTESEIQSLTLYDVIADQKRWIDHNIDVVLPRDRKLPSQTLSFLRKDGSTFDLERSACLVSIEDRDAIMMLGRDIADRRHNRLAEFLHETTIDILRHRDQDKILEVLVGKAMSLAGAPAGYCLLLDECAGEMRIAAAVGFDAGYLSTGIKKGEGLSGYVWRSGEALAVDDYKHWDGRLPESRFDRVFAAAAFPLKNSAAEVIGILAVLHFDPAKRIHKDDFTCLDEVARLTSLALDNARLYNTARVEIATRAGIEMQLRGAYEKLDTTYDTTLEGWARALDLRDCETEGHSRRVASVAVAMARVMNLPEEQHIQIWRGALLHDIGKLGVPDSILLKPASLTEEEWQIMRLHPVYGYDWLLPIEYLQPALAIPRSHHERWDGTGYPDRLRGEDIPLQARIFAPIDVWDALSSNRPYRRSWPADKIREHIRALAGSHFDPAVVEVFLSLPPSALVLQEKSPYKIPF